MRLDIGVIGAVICLSAIFDLSSPGVSAFFFPNASAMPPSLRPNFTGSPWEAFNNYTGCRQGDKRDGLGKLKKYFNEFGYIPDGGSGNFTDDFDDALEAAVKAYQKNFNLEQTGQLDDATLKQIVKPRCGNPDIVNGTSTMSSRLANSTSSIFHTVGHYTFFPGTPRWPSDRRDLTYAFLPGNGLSNDTKVAFERAFQRWAEVTPLTFTATSSYSSADITVGFYTGDHGDGEAFDGVLGSLAHAFSPPNGRFHLDGAEDWIIGGDVTTASVSTAVDLESVAVHEIGHLLGLGHSSVEESIMYPTITARTRKVQLAADDIEGIQVLYGSNPNYNGSSTVDSTQEREFSHGGPRLLTWTAAAAATLSAVGLSLLLF